VRLRDAADAHTFQGREEPASARVAEAAEGEGEDQDNGDEERDGQEIVVDDERG
jgi:hypothetical protein